MAPTWPSRWKGCKKARNPRPLRADNSGVERRSAIQALANYALFERASTTSIEAIISGASFQEMAAGSMLLEEGTPADRVCFVLSGVVRIFHTGPEGRQFTPKILQAPNHFGDL